MDLLIAFGLGVMIGVIIGIFLMALAVSRGNDRGRFDG